MTQIEATKQQKLAFKAHYGFSKIPFDKTVWAKNMYDSESQLELRSALEIFTEIRGFALVIGPAGSGKSITVRRFVHDLDNNRFAPIEISTSVTTINGFLRHLARKLGLTVKQHTADIFDDVQLELSTFEAGKGPHPILVIDDAEGMSPAVLDIIRKLSTTAYDSENRFSVVLSGTETLTRTLQQQQLEPLRSRFGISITLRPFGMEDTTGYINFHLKMANASPGLFTPEAVRKIFQTSKGRPRIINQLATHGLVFGAIWRDTKITGDNMACLINDHPLYGKHRAEN